MIIFYMLVYSAMMVGAFMIAMKVVTRQNQPLDKPKPYDASPVDRDFIRGVSSDGNRFNLIERELYAILNNWEPAQLQDVAWDRAPLVKTTLQLLQANASDEVVATHLNNLIEAEYKTRVDAQGTATYIVNWWHAQHASQA
jgi:hypothetical protein